MAITKIEWTDRVWNPVRGCSKVSSGCENCYAERMASRFCGPGQPYDGLVWRPSDGRSSGWTGEARFVPDMLDAPLHWRKPCRVFVNSMSDLFHESITDHDRDAVLAAMLLSPRHTYQVLTKRPACMVRYLSDDGLYNRVLVAAQELRAKQPELSSVGISDPTRLPAKWIHWGVSVENQAAANERIPLLLLCPAVVRWVSCEPLIGAIRLDRLTDDELGASWDSLRAEGCLDWVVCGGESGPQARPMRHGWATSLRDQCKSANIPFFFKQWGEWLDNGTLVERVGKKRAGNMLDGICYEMMPDDKW